MGDHQLPDIETRVAKVIHRTTENVRGSWEKLHPGIQERYQIQARAVLKEINTKPSVVPEKLRAVGAS